MKLKDLLNKEFKIIVTAGTIFDEDDISNVGEDYEVSEEDISQRIKNIIESGELSLKYCEYTYNYEEKAV